jgi:predicted ATPase
MKDFKAFKDLEIQIPTRPSLVVLCGENGSGKSSINDAIASWRNQQHWGFGGDPAFFRRGGDRAAVENGVVEIDFHGDVNPGDRRAAVYVRTAQRITVEFTNPGLSQIQPAIELPGPPRSIDVDDRIAEDYQRLISLSVDAVWDEEQRDRPAGEFVDRVVGGIADPLTRLIPGLKFDRPDKPFREGSTFRFSKGGLAAYGYKQLSGGEKAVFDLLLDTTLKRADFSDAIWCIDEPELHVNPRIHGALLREMLALLPDTVQLWISTHSPGMLAEARRMYEQDHDAVAFVDLGGVDPAEPRALSPSAPSRTFWKQQLSVVLGDLASLIAPSRVVLCEGSPVEGDRSKARWDSQVLERIFSGEFPDVGYLSVGNSDDVVGDRMDVGAALATLADGVEILKVIDRDGRSVEQIEELASANGCRVLRRRHLESYLLDGEVLDLLCEVTERPEKKAELRAALADAIQESISRGNDPDDMKRAASQFVNKARGLLNVRSGGSDTASFLRDTVAPCVRPGMVVYDELRADVFGGG